MRVETKVEERKNSYSGENSKLEEKFYRASGCDWID